MTDRYARLRAAYQRRDTVFASEGKTQLSDAELRELHDALVEAGPGLLEAVDAVRARDATIERLRDALHIAAEVVACHDENHIYLTEWDELLKETGK